MKIRSIVLFLTLAFNLASQAANPTCGLTIITHGFQPAGGYMPGWVRDMAEAITNRIGVSLPIYRVRYDKQTGGTTDDDLIVLEDGATDIDISQAGGAIILLDWAAASNELDVYPTQDVGDRFAAYLFGQAHSGHNLGEIPIHLIGHSRGGSLNSRLAQGLAINGILVDQVTTLDPHPVTVFGSDFVPQTFINVLFADNYYQANNFPEGMQTAGAYSEDLSAVLSGLIFEGHEQVHAYYHGTIDLSATSVDGVAIASAWYQNTFPRVWTGYNFSRYMSQSRPSSGINQFIAGAGGTGSRVSVDSPLQVWSNAGFDQRSPVASVVTVGQTVDIPYYFADRNSQQTITFYTDADTNPFNGQRSQIGSVNQNSRPAGSIGTATFQWTPTAADVGTHFIRVKGENASGFARYDYFFKTITVQAPLAPSTPTGVSASDGTYCGFVRVSWNSVSGAAGYKVYRDGNFVADDSSSPYDDAPGNTSSHSYTVKATNAWGGSGLGGPDSGYSSCPCSYSLNQTSTNISALAFAGAFNVTVGAGCSWSASTAATWLHTGSSGSGNGTVNYTVDANPSSPRSGTITVGGQTFTLNQAGNTCTYTLIPTSANCAPPNASGSFTVTSQAGCSWTASTAHSWIHTSNSGSGNGVVSYTVDANAGIARVGTITVSGQAFTIYQAGQLDQFTYTINNGTITITKYTGSGGAVTIPSTTYGLPVTSIGDFAFYGTSLTSVTIPDSVTSIGTCAFNNCASLSAITVDALNIFYSSVAGVLFNKSQTTLIQCPGGKAGSFIVPNTVTSIGDWAFQYCERLTSVTIPNSVTSIGDAAFNDCVTLTSVTIPNSVTNIGGDAFLDCATLSSVIIGNSVTAIGFGAFARCASLTSVTIPNSVTSIEGLVFSGCTSLTNVTIPNTVIYIWYGAFYDCTSLTSVTIPDSVTTIGTSAFNSCIRLTNVTIGNSVTNIGNSAFNSCRTLTSVIVPNSVTSIGSGAFYDCERLTTVSIGNSVTSIGSAAFNSCTSLTSVTIGNSVSSIESSAFAYCERLTSVLVPNSVTSIGEEAFVRCYSLASVSIGTSVISIGRAAFYECSLASVTIPGSVTSIGDGAFARCHSLSAITVVALNSSYSSVAGVLFNKSQTTLIQYPQGKAGSDYTIPSSVTTIGTLAFHSCTSLTGVFFQGNAPSLGSQVFYWADNATVYYLPGTTGWGSTFGGRPTALWLLPNPVILNNSPSFGAQTNGFAFVISWATNILVVVEASTNLANPMWSPLQTNTLTGGSFYFTDPQSTNYPGRFYRLRSP